MIQLDEEKDDPEMKDVPFMDEMPPSNSVVLSDLYALTTKVGHLAICHGGWGANKQTTFYLEIISEGHFDKHNSKAAVVDKSYLPLSWVGGH